MKKNFWEKKKLNELSLNEWESLCDGCGKCCLLKLEDEETGKIEFTNVGCKLLSSDNCKCIKYDKRHKIVDDCIKLEYKNINKIKWLPNSCSYKLLYEGKKLPDWHHLITNDHNTIHTTGNSIQGKFVSENENLDLEDYIIESV